MSESDDWKIVNAELAEEALRHLIHAIEATGGVILNEEGIVVPVADEDWSDLADAYTTACEAVGRKPMRAGALACVQCGKPFMLDEETQTTSHVFEDGVFDYDTNEDHVAYGEEGGL